MAMLAVAGCGGGSPAGGIGGHGGEGGSAGAIGTGGALVTGGTGGAGLPACTILMHPASDGGACSTLVAAGPLVPVEPVNDNFQGGVVEDGGVQVQPAGG